MDILVTNDDGIDSPGLWALAEAMSRVGDTMVVAPQEQQSGVGTSVSLHNEMDVAEVPSPVPGVVAYSVCGTPSDCVILALRRLAGGRRFDLLVSGINLGGNMGHDIPYSGTVMATLQGYFRGIPSIAVSLAIRERDEEPDFDVTAWIAESLARRVETGEMPTEAIINVNVPNIPRQEIKGVVATKTASSAFVKLAEVQGSSSLRYQMSSRPAVAANFPQPTVGGNSHVIEEGTDIWAICHDLISITPLRINVTDHDSIPALKDDVLALESELFRRGDGG